MKLETFLLVLSLITYSALVNAIKFKDNGYYNVLVSISPDVQADHDERALIVENIKVLSIVHMS